LAFSNISLAETNIYRPLLEILFTTLLYTISKKKSSD
jgi:hypothetical protein